LAIINGEYIDVPSIDVSIVFSEEEAIQKAKEHIGANKYMWEEEYNIVDNEKMYPKAMLVIL